MIGVFEKKTPGSRRLKVARWGCEGSTPESFQFERGPALDCTVKAEVRRAYSDMNLPKLTNLFYGVT